MEKMKEVFSDEAFVKDLFELETATEVQAALMEKGVEMSEEEILAVRDLLAKMESGEISVEQAEQWSKQAESGELSDKCWSRWPAVLPVLQSSLSMLASLSVVKSFRLVLPLS